MEQEDKRITTVVTRNVIPGRERDYEEWLAAWSPPPRGTVPLGTRSSLQTPVPHVGC